MCSSISIILHTGQSILKLEVGHLPGGIRNFTRSDQERRAVYEHRIGFVCPAAQ